MFVFLCYYTLPEAKNTIIMERKMNKITLTNGQNVAYWWIKTLKKKVNELNKREELTDDEESFVEIFDMYDSEEWRLLYVELSYDIEEYMQNNDRFFQCTQEGGHNKMNNYISAIVGYQVPDICLTVNNSSIAILNGVTIESYEDDYKVLNSEYNENYVLTGDESLLTSRKTVLA